MATTIKERPRILMFENETTILKRMEEHFLHLGATVDAFSKDVNAYNALQSREYDAALIDINDAAGSPVGLGLISLFKEKNRGREAYMVTGYSNYRRQAQELGAKYISKPMRSAQREAIVNKLKTELKLRGKPLTFKYQHATAVVEGFEDDRYTLTFRHARKWFLVRLPSLHFRARLEPGAEIGIEILVDGKQELSGIQIRELPETDASITTANEITGIPENVNFNDPKAVEEYRNALKNFFSDAE